MTQMLVSVVASRDNTPPSNCPTSKRWYWVPSYALFVGTAASGGHDELVVKNNESLRSTVGKIQLNRSRLAPAPHIAAL